MTNIELVPATREIVEKGLKLSAKNTLRGIAAVRGDEVLGVAAITIQDGQAIMIAHFTDELRGHKRVIVRGIRRMMAMAMALNLPLYAECDPTIEKAEAFLKHLGFAHVKGRIYAWLG